MKHSLLSQNPEPLSSYSSEVVDKMAKATTTPNHAEQSPAPGTKRRWSQKVDPQPPPQQAEGATNHGSFETSPQGETTGPVAKGRTSSKRKKQSDYESPQQGTDERVDDTQLRRNSSAGNTNSKDEGGVPPKRARKGPTSGSAAKEAKPKKLSKAAKERAKLEELRNDPHFGKLDEDSIKRISKAYLERLYLIHRFRNVGLLKEEFDVCGSKGNIYKATLANTVRCTCIDFSIRRRACKHLLFVFLRVLRIPGHLPVYTTTDLTNADLEQIFSEAQDDPVAEALATPDLRKAWETAVGYKPDAETDSSTASQASNNNRKQGKRLIPEGDLCGVCYEDFEPGQEDSLEYCLRSCGRALHRDCLETWARSVSRGPVTCIWCRAEWYEPRGGQGSADPSVYTNGYGIGVGSRGTVVDANTGRQLNLAAAAGIRGRYAQQPE